jgi:hypothetical protein
MMLRQVENFHLRVIVIAVFYAFGFSACGGSYEDTIAGIMVPVPKPMAKSSEAPVEMKFFGFAAGQSTYPGKMESDKIVEFYKRELPRARLAAGATMRSGGAMLVYTKNAKTLMVAIGKQNDDTSLTLTVAEIRR